MRWLLDVIDSSVERFGMTGKERALLFRLAVSTGLRAGEPRSLTRGSFQLDGDEPSGAIAAAYTKNRREDVLPLRLDTAAPLRKHVESKMPAAPAFAIPPANG